MKWGDHRGWVLGSTAAFFIAIVAAVFSVVYASYYNRTHHIGEFGALSTFLRTPFPLWFVLPVVIALGVFIRQSLLNRRRNRFLESQHRETSLQETANQTLLAENSRLRKEIADIESTKPRVHVSWWIGEGSWSTGEILGETYMFFNAKASFSTTNATEMVMLTKAYIRGTEPRSNIMLTKIPVSGLIHQVFFVQVKPVLATTGEDYPAKFIFIDTKGNEYESPEHKFRYTAPVQGVVSEPRKNIMPLPPR